MRCNFNVAVQPLSVDKYVNQDRVIVNVLCHRSPVVPDVDCSQEGDEIYIGSCGDYSDCLCIIEAPIKANIDVEAREGCVNVGSFENDRLRVRTEGGNVDVDKFQSDDFEVATGTGDVTCRKNTQAMNIKISSDSGRIKTDKLQGRNLVVRTESGTVTSHASYCDSSLFETETGNFYLQNVHKNCRINIRKNGNVSLLVFDGTLQLNMEKGTAEVLFSRILGDSSIVIKENGSLVMKVVDSCFDETTFKIATKDCAINGQFDILRKEDSFVIRPNVKQGNVLDVVCTKGSVVVENTTMMELFRLLKQIKE